MITNSGAIESHPDSTATNSLTRLTRSTVCLNYMVAVREGSSLIRSSKGIWSILMGLRNNPLTCERFRRKIHIPPQLWCRSWFVVNQCDRQGGVPINPEGNLRKPRPSTTIEKLFTAFFTCPATLLNLSTLMMSLGCLRSQLGF